MKNYLITIYDNYIGILSTIFADRLWIKIVSSILSFATVFIAAYLKSFDLNKLSKAHKEAANRPLIVQNEITHRYTSTISAPGSNRTADLRNSKDCLEKALCQMTKNGHLAGITAARCLCFHTFRVKYEKIPGGKCNEEAERLEAERKAEAERLERERKEEEHRIAVEKRKKKAKKVFIAIASVACVCAVFLILLKTVIIPKQRINKIKTANVGDIIVFGTYEQDNNISNGKELIEWLVLAKKGNRVLVISDKALDCQLYNNTSDYYKNITWEICSLRKWLNADFINVAFSAEEQSKIQSTTVSADKNPKYGSNPGNATTDKVFSLSINEVNKYFTSDEARRCVPTAYAKANGANVIDNYHEEGTSVCCWLLRTPGNSSCSVYSYSSYYYNDIAFVYFNGSVNYSGNAVDTVGFAVRPALWITIDG